MTNEQFNKSVTDSIKNLVNKAKTFEELEIERESWCADQDNFNKAKLPESFSEWLEQNGDSIEIDDHGGNFTPDRIASNHDIYKNGNPFQ